MADLDMVCAIREDALMGLPVENLTFAEGRDCYEQYTSLPETVIYAIYALVATVLGFGGNMIVILATLKYTVFSLDSITMVFVRHLAIADIMYIVIRIFPVVTVHFGRGWVLGRGMCILQANLVTISTLSSMNFILTISIHRLLRCMFPLRFSLSVRNKATVLAIILWVYSTMGAVCSLALKIDVYFRPSIAACDVDYSSQPIVAIVGVVIQMLIPFFAIVVLNGAMYMIARQRFKDLSNNQALMTVACVSGLFVFSWLPSILVIILGVSGVSSTSLIWLDKVQINFYFLSVFGNPVLYSLVHKGFGKFARSKFSIFLRKCQNSVEAQWQNSVSKSSDQPPGPADSDKSVGMIPGRRGSKREGDIRRAGSCDLINEGSTKSIEQPIVEDAACKSDDNSKDSGLCSAS